jgi:hypothetical protein
MEHDSTVDAVKHQKDLEQHKPSKLHHGMVSAAAA